MGKEEGREVAYRAKNHIFHSLEEVVFVRCMRFMGEFVEDSAAWELGAEVCDDAGFGVLHCDVIDGEGREKGGRGRNERVSSSWFCAVCLRKGAVGLRLL